MNVALTHGKDPALGGDQGGTVVAQGTGVQYGGVVDGDQDGSAVTQGTNDISYFQDSKDGEDDPGDSVAETGTGETDGVRQYSRRNWTCLNFWARADPKTKMRGLGG